MASKSRWANTEDDARLEAQRKREKEEKKRAKAEKQREAERAAAAAAAIRQEQTIDDSKLQNGYTDDAHGPPLKRRRAEDGAPSPVHASQPIRLQRFEGDGWRPSRSVEEFEMMNEIAEGGYGAVTRVKEKATGRIAAVKRLKYDHKDAGIPGSGMREIQLLRDCNHEHIIKLQEVCVNDSKASLGRVFLVRQLSDAQTN